MPALVEASAVPVAARTASSCGGPDYNPTQDGRFEVQIERGADSTATPPKERR